MNVAAFFRSFGDKSYTTPEKLFEFYQQMTAGGGMSEYTGGVAKTVSMFSKLMNQGSALVVEGVNFVLKENVSIDCETFFFFVITIY